MKIEKYSNFPVNQYYKTETPKKIIVLHHTVSGEGVKGDINWWLQTPEKVGTPYIIDREGVITEIFDPKYWIHHLGIKQATLSKYNSTVSNERLNQLSIGIELDSWGALEKKGDKYFSYTGKEVKPENVQYFPNGYRGAKYYEKYSSKQLESLKELLLHLSKTYGIKLNYFPEMFEVSAKALKGYHGIWSHTSYRGDKSDVIPQPELIQMLESIKQN